MHHHKSSLSKGLKGLSLQSKKQAPVSETTVGLSALATGLSQIYSAVTGLEGIRNILPGEPGYNNIYPGLNHLVVENGQEVVLVLPWHPGCGKE